MGGGGGGGEALSWEAEAGMLNCIESAELSDHR